MSIEHEQQHHLRIGVVPSSHTTAIGAMQQIDTPFTYDIYNDKLYWDAEARGLSPL